MTSTAGAGRHVMSTLPSIPCNTSISGYYVDRWLDFRSDEKAYLYLPVIIYLLVLILIGVIGNIIVIYIYALKYKRQPSNYFIITMAAFDLLAAAIVMPLDIYDLRFHYTFYNDVACKVFRYGYNFTTYGSAIVLVEIAYDRYMKICQPLRTETYRRTKIMCWCAFVLALLLGSPATLLFGITFRVIPNQDFCGYDCSIAHKYKGGKFQSVFYSMLILLFLLTFGLFLYFYVRIWLAIRARNNSVIGETSRTYSASDRRNSGGGSIVKNRKRLPSNQVSDDDSVFLHNKGDAIALTKMNGRLKLSSVSSSLKSAAKVSRTTKIFVVVTVAFVLSYLPAVVVMVIRSFIDDVEVDSSSVVQVFLKLFARTHFINNAINPIIYSFLNVNFRVQCAKTLRGFSRGCNAKMTRDTRRSFGSGSRKMKVSKTDSNKSVKTKEYEIEHLKEEMGSRI